MKPSDIDQKALSRSLANMEQALKDVLLEQSRPMLKNALPIAWEIQHVDAYDHAAAGLRATLLQEGWEPFAVDDRDLWFRRQVAR